MTTLLVLTGIATYYVGPVGNPLWCGETYSVDNEPWVALSVDLYEEWRCGDRVILYFPNGVRLEARALDAGPLHKFYIEDFPDQKLLVDVPVHLWPLPVMSSPVRLVNATLAAELFEYHVGR